MNTLFTYTYQRALMAALLAATIIALVAYTMLTIERIHHVAGVPATISVTGDGEVFAVPDVGQFSFSVTAKADTAEAAQEQSGTAINDILDFLAESGVSDTDIKTRNYNLYPQYRWVEPICEFGQFCGSGERVADGFEVNQTIEVKVRDTDTASAIVTGVGERGATNISGVTFVVDDTDALVAQARSAAIADAKVEAKRLAADLGVRLVRITGYYEDGGNKFYDPMPFEARSFSLEAAEADFGGPSLPVGEDKITSNVTITYEVK